MRRPGSSLGAILMLAAGLAAVAASSGLASTLLFRPISTRYPDEVRRLASSDLGGRTRLAFSEVELERVRDSMAGVANIAVANLQPVVLRIGDTDMQTLAEVVGGRYFDMIGLDVAVGRPLVDGDAAAGAPPVAVISEGLWRDHFGRDASALGAAIRLNGRAFTIVGITASKSTSSFLGGSVDAWITLAHADAMLDRSWRTNPDNRWWTTLVHPAGRGSGPRPRVRVAALERATAALATRLPDPWRERKLITVPGTVMAGSQRNCGGHALDRADGVRAADSRRGGRQRQRPVSRGRRRRSRPRRHSAGDRIGAGGHRAAAPVRGRPARRGRRRGGAGACTPG